MNSDEPKSGSQTPTITGYSGSREEIKRIYWFLGGVVLFVVITFWIELISLHWNNAKDKSMMLQNNQMNKDYFDKVLLLNDKVNNLNTSIEVMKTRNYLK